MSRAVALSVVAIVLIVLPGMLRQDPAPAVPFQEMTAETEQDIREGLAWLAESQNRDGSWGCEKGAAPSTGLTGLSGLAFLAAGSTPTEGAYARNIRDAVDFLLRSQHRVTGLITAFDAVGFGPLYDHSCAVMFLAEILGMMREGPDNDELRDRLIRAVDFLERAQNEDGGWGMSPRSQPSALTTTAAAFTALRAAANGGIPVNYAKFERVERFARSCATRGGTFNEYGGGGGNGQYYPTAAGLRVLYGMGRWDSPEARSASQWMTGRLMGQDYGGRLSEWCYAGLIWAGMAMLHDSQGQGTYWRAWWPRNRQHLHDKQNGDGSWTVEYCASCRVLATSISLVVLQAPRRNLPLWDL